VTVPDTAWIAVFPSATPVANPPLVIVATPVFVELHVAVLVRFCVLPSLYVPVAVYCCVAPTSIEKFAGVTAIDTNTAGVTVNPVVPVIAPETAWIVVFPTPAPVAKPLLLIVATPVLVELHTTDPVILAVLPSLYIPVAVYCCVAPFAIDAFAGATTMETSVAITVKFVVPLIEPDVAQIVVVPTPTPDANPPLVIVAAAVFVELHVTILVRFCVLLSLYVPVAVYCCVVPLAIVAFAGVTAIEINVGGVTVSPVVPVIPPEAAWIVVLPVPVPVANPPPVIVATPVLVELHTTDPVIFAVLPSLYIPVAVYCCVAPFAIDPFAGVTEIDTNDALPPWYNC